MHHRLLIGSVIALIIVLVISCSSALYQPLQSDVVRMEQQHYTTTLTELEQGRNLYIQHCNECHSLHLPQQFTIEQWEKILPDMGVEAHISDSTANIIFKYLGAGAQQTGS